MKQKPKDTNCKAFQKDESFAISVFWFLFHQTTILRLFYSFFVFENFSIALSETVVNWICFLDPGVRFLNYKNKKKHLMFLNKVL